MRKKVHGERSARGGKSSPLPYVCKREGRGWRDRAILERESVCYTPYVLSFLNFIFSLIFSFKKSFLIYFNF